MQHGQTLLNYVGFSICFAPPFGMRIVIARQRLKICYDESSSFCDCFIVEWSTFNVLTFGLLFFFNKYRFSHSIFLLVIFRKIAFRMRREFNICSRCVFLRNKNTYNDVFIIFIIRFVQVLFFVTVSVQDKSRVAVISLVLKYRVLKIRYTKYSIFMFFNN